MIHLWWWGQKLFDIYFQGSSEAHQFKVCDPSDLTFNLSKGLAT